MRAIKIVCFLLVIAAAPLWLMMSMLSPMLLDAGPQNMTRPQWLSTNAVIIAIWLLPLWAVYFGWRTIRTWNESTIKPAVLMALPGIAIVALFAVINLAGASR